MRQHQFVQRRVCVNVDDAAAISSVASSPVEEEKDRERTAFVREGWVLRHVATCIAILRKVRKQHESIKGQASKP